MTDRLISEMQAEILALKAYLLGPAFIFSPIYLPTTVLIAYLVWRARHRGTPFLAFLAPRELYGHASTRTDVKLAIFNLLTQAPLALPLAALTPAVTYGLLGLLGGTQAAQVETTWLQGAGAAVILLFTEDFVRYLNHYLHHRSKILWPFHAVHHSAEVLTPISFMRAHPVYYTVQRLMMAGIGGSIQALLIFALVGQIDFWMLYMATLVFHTYVFLGAHLRHSHIRLSYGRALEHILISPAQHQIHHSVDPRHYNKNLGEIFALWDWMFGTLYIPDGNEDLRFGLGDDAGRPVAQPYPTLWAAMVRPFAESASALHQRVRSDGSARTSLETTPREQ